MLGALCSRSTWSRRLEADNRQEQLALIREAAEKLAAIESMGGAQAAPDALSGPKPCASSAHDAGCCGCRPCVALWAASRPVLSSCTIGLLTCDSGLVMCMLWA